MFNFFKKNNKQNFVIPPKPTINRSPKWPALEKKWLKEHPTCAVCGSDNKRGTLAVHHIIPFHIDPTRELDETNLMTLCENKSRICHFVFGHLYNWKLYNKTIETDVILLIEDFKNAEVGGGE
jgi:5-methylcytosine-specific restriction endonuclease McrA